MRRDRGLDPPARRETTRDKRMANAKTDSRPQKRNVPLAERREDCERRFHRRFGRAFTEADRRRILDNLDGPTDAREARGRIMLIALRDGSAMATGSAADATVPISDHDLAVLLVLLGVLEPTKSDLAKLNVAELLERERATFAKLRKTYDRLRRSIQAGVSDTAAFETWAEHGFAMAAGPEMVARLASQGDAPSEHRPGRTKLDLARAILDNSSTCSRDARDAASRSSCAFGEARSARGLAPRACT